MQLEPYKVVQVCAACADCFIFVQLGHVLDCASCAAIADCISLCSLGCIKFDQLVQLVQLRRVLGCASGADCIIL